MLRGGGGVLQSRLRCSLHHLDRGGEAGCEGPFQVERSFFCSYGCHVFMMDKSLNFQSGTNALFVHKHHTMKLWNYRWGKQHMASVKAGESSSCLFTFIRMELHLAANFGDTFRFYSPIDYPLARPEQNPYWMDHFSSNYNVGSTCFGIYMKKSIIFFKFLCHLFSFPCLQPVSSSSTLSWRSSAALPRGAPSECLAG